MSISYERLALERWALPVTAESELDQAEARYWKSFEGVLRQRLPSACSHCAWAPGESRALDGSPVLRLACCVSLNVQLLGSSSRSSRTLVSHKTSARTADVCYGVSWRRDGKLLAAGDALGNVYVMDSTTGSILRAMSSEGGVDVFAKKNRAKKGASAARCTAWSRSSGQPIVLSGSDAGRALLWDVSAGTQSSSFEVSAGEIRAVAFAKGHEWLASSYDGAVYLLDDRAPKPQAIFQHGSPVEDLAVAHASFASCGGTCVTVWDLRKNNSSRSDNAEVARWRNAHAKTVTCVAFSGKRVITGALDGYVKSHSIVDPASSVKVSGGNGPVLSLAYAVGLSSKQTTNEDDSAKHGPAYSTD